MHYIRVRGDVGKCVGERCGRVHGVSVEGVKKCVGVWGEV